MLIDSFTNGRRLNRHSFGEQFPAKKWAREAAGQRDVLAAYGGVRLEDVRGLRAPFLSVSFRLILCSHDTLDWTMDHPARRSEVTGCSKCFTTWTSPTTRQCPSMRTSRLPGPTLWIIKSSTTAWFHHALPNLTQVLHYYNVRHQEN